MVEVSTDKVVVPFGHGKRSDKARSSSTTASNTIW
jgi:hypothetical protein